MTRQPVQLNAEVVNGRSSLSGGAAMRAAILRTGRLCIVAVAVVTGLLLAACSSNTTSSPAAATTASSPAAASSPSPTSAVCQAAAELRTSVNNLAHVKLGAGTVNGIKSDLANVQAKLTALTTELRDANKTQTSEVQSAVDTLKTAVSNFGAHPGSSTLQGMATAVAGLITATNHLLTSLNPQCGSASVSPTS